MMCPLDYSLCCQTVTLYRRRGEEIFRQVVDSASYSYQTRQVTDALGTRQETLFELILPGDWELRPGDRVFDGVGPEVTGENWKEFTPVCVAGLSQVQYVQRCCWQGTPCHILAGRK